MNDAMRRLWPVASVAVLALLYVWVGLAAHRWDHILGIVGGLVVIGALVVAYRSRWASMVLLAVGALPLAVTTWWSIVTPLLAALAMLLGWFAIRNLSRPRDDSKKSTLESPA